MSVCVSGAMIYGALSYLSHCCRVVIGLLSPAPLLCSDLFSARLGLARLVSLQPVASSVFGGLDRIGSALCSA